MKKRSLFVIALLFSSLTGCGGSYKAPTNEHDKVKVAFNGVEKSFKKIASGKSLNTRNKLQPRYKNVDSGLSSIFGLYSNADIRGHSIEDLSYNEPPMIQFQYLKAVFDKLGNGYEFGTKYYDVITGDIFLDIDTGLKDEEKKAENQYSFNYKLAIDINIDSNDLINADVSFDIDFSQGTRPRFLAAPFPKPRSIRPCESSWWLSWSWWWQPSCCSKPRPPATPSSKFRSSRYSSK